MSVNRYKHNLDCSYTLGATLTLELLKYKHHYVKRIFIQSQTIDSDGIRRIYDECSKYCIPIEQNDKAFNVLSQKENCYVIGEFSKYSTKINNQTNQIVLVNPSNAGNLGTIIRTMAGFNILDLAIIKPGTDIFDPKVIRSSMGSIFHINFQYYDSFEEYLKENSNLNLYPFMLKGKKSIENIEFKKPCALVFGNEATGLVDEFLNVGNTVVINHSNLIDSLNLPIAASIAMYEMNKYISK